MHKKVCMLYHLSQTITNTLSYFNVVHYVSFRIVAGLLTSLGLSLFFGSWFIKQSARFRTTVREDTPVSHQIKNYTPTMGGIFIILTTIVSAILWCNLLRPEVWVMLGCLVGFGLIGFYDDWYKITHKKGIQERTKFCAQAIVGLVVILSWYYLVEPPTELCVPFFKSFMPQLGYFIIPWGVFVLIAASNAVNLTDGLDGLATGSLLVTFGTYTLICFLSSNMILAYYLAIPYTTTSEIAVIGGILVGACLGFLWYNSYPAQVFMGDVGSLSLGSVLALMALMTRQELLLPLAGGVFVLETLSVMIQVFSYKYLSKRFFKMAPLHHHFELKGWPEAKITTRFTIISMVLCLLALITLKVR